MRLFDFLDFTPNGKVRYHWRTLRPGAWVAIDLTQVRSRWSDDPQVLDDEGERKLWGDKVRNALFAYGTHNGIPVKVTLKKPYEFLHVCLDYRG